MADAIDTPAIPEPVWHEYSRTVTVQAYKVEEDNHVIITVDGKQNIGAGNWVVNENGFLSVTDEESFVALYPEAAESEAPAKK